jgi:hypothetical protein
MSSVEFILCQQDTNTIRRALADHDLCVIYNERLSRPVFNLAHPDTIVGRHSVSLYVTKKDWIFGEFSIRRLTNQVTKEIYYDLSPRVNFSSISLSFYIGNSDDGKCKLGFGDLDVYPTWLKSPGSELCKAPSETAKVYRALRRRFQKDGTVLSTPRGDKIVMQYALEKIVKGSHEMPHLWLEEIAAQQLRRNDSHLRLP